MSNNKKKSSRSLARGLAVQGLYYHRVNNSDIAVIEDFLRYICTSTYTAASYELMHFLLTEAISSYNDMLDLYTSYSSRNPSDIHLTEQSILVIAAVELKLNLSVPTVVIINEAVELAKSYGSKDSYRFINSLIDKLAPHLRNT